MPNKEFTFPMLNVDRKTGVILEVTGYGPNVDSSYKFEIVGGTLPTETISETIAPTIATRSIIPDN